MTLPITVTVPCGGCTRCCWNDMVRILPHEDASRWQTEPHPARPDARMLAHRPDGACIYLGEACCTIYGDRPEQCQSMDCRNIAAAITMQEARRLGLRRVWARGNELLRRASQ